MMKSEYFECACFSDERTLRFLYDKEDNEKNLAAINLINKWLNEDSDYDKKHWPIIEKLLKE